MPNFARISALWTVFQQSLEQSVASAAGAGPSCPGVLDEEGAPGVAAGLDSVLALAVGTEAAGPSDGLFPPPEGLAPARDGDH